MTADAFNPDEIYNEGERLIPFLSHDDNETIRHLSSHIFFKQIIINDMKSKKLRNLSVLDLGFGTGYASFVYASIDGVASVKSIDVSEDSLEWARDNYYNEKINYEICDAKKFIKKSKPFSYILTRHVLEHIEDGLNVVKEENFNNRLCINVPFNEKKGNPYHILTGIQQSDFPKFENVEFFYEDLHGNTYDKIPDGIFINSIICIASKRGMPKVKDYFTFPVKAPSIEVIFRELSTDNFNFVKNILSIQNKRVRQGAEAIKKYDELKADLTKELKRLKQDNLKLQKELRAVYDSKRWRYSTAIAGVKNIVPKK